MRYYNSSNLMYALAPAIALESSRILVPVEGTADQTSLPESTKGGRRDDARAMLAEIYCCFTEGFDTAHLKEAKTLLEQLPA